MALEVASTDLVIVGLHSESPVVYWKGRVVPGIVGIRADSEGGDWSIKLRVNGSADDLYTALSAAGIVIKKVH